MDWAARHAIPLHRVEFIVPFVETDFSLSVTLFHETNADVEASTLAGHSAALQEEFMQALARLKYPSEWQSLVTFEPVDSHENVVDHYEGSYFYRMR